MKVPDHRWSRREWLQVAGLVAAGFGIGALIRANRPLGRDVSGFAGALALQRDPAGPAQGPADADVQIIAFTDYLCPACRKAAPELAAALDDDGRARVIYKDWPIFGPVAEQLARVALAAEHQGIYPEVHHALMAQRPPGDRGELRELIEREGGDWVRLERDLSVHAPDIEAMLGRNRRDAFALGLAGTPAFLVGTVLIEGALTSSQFARAFRQSRET